MQCRCAEVYFPLPVVPRGNRANVRSAVAVRVGGSEVKAAATVEMGGDVPECWGIQLGTCCNLAVERIAPCCLLVGSQGDRRMGAAA